MLKDQRAKVLMSKSKDNLQGIVLSIMWVQGLNSVCETCYQAHVPTESSFPTLILYIV